MQRHRLGVNTNSRITTGVNYDHVTALNSVCPILKLSERVVLGTEFISSRKELVNVDCLADRDSHIFVCHPSIKKKIQTFLSIGLFHQICQSTPLMDCLSSG